MLTTQLKRFLVLLLAWIPFAANATEFDHLLVGQEVTDNVIGVGQFRIRLPDQGVWIVASKQSVQGGKDPASWEPPVRQTVAVAQSSNGALSAVLIFGAPAKSYKSVRWNDDPCAGVTDFVVKDTMNQVFGMPECFAVLRFREDDFYRTSGGPFSDIVNWASNLRLAWPEHFIRVFYTKYGRGDYLRANLYLPGSVESAQRVELWGRQVAASMAAAVIQGTMTATILPLPALPNSPVSTDVPRATSTSPSAKSAESRMLELKSLLEKGLITNDDYNEKRKKILQDL